MRARTRERLEECERTAADAAQRAARAEATVDRLREALEELPLAVVVVDESGDEVARNHRASAFVGERPVDVLVADAVRKAIAAAAVGGREERAVELQGPPVRALRVVAERLPGGGIVAVVEDESERRRLDAVRRDFVANVSHELRTPVGALSLLAETMAVEDDATVLKRLAARVSAEAERAAALVADLLDLSRIEAEGDAEAGGAPRERVTVVDVVDAAVERTQAVAERSGITFAVNADPAVSVAGDREQLLSAVANLLHNAVSYSDEGTTVSIDVAVQGAMVDIAVRDHGIGIPAKDLERIFERFYRVDRARDRRTGGTGLGLSIVRHVATNHGGEVLVESREGEGSTFTLRLPMAGNG
ncbi:MAG: two-component sensor histidine kinase [Actinobacteria bacterium]|nr:two-component sensor histidine kinase [Actinomycetota bacterium]